MTKAKITTYRVCIIFKYMPDMSQWGMGEGDVVDSLYLSKSFETFLTSMYILIIILSESRSVVSNSLRPHGLTMQSTEFFRILEWVAFLFTRGSSQPRNRTQVSHTVQADSLPAEPRGKPKYTGVGSLPLLQQIFLTQELNQGLLYSRRILYQLSHNGSPRTLEWVAYPFSRGSAQPRN